MEIEITLKNYRCFPDTRPARLVIRPGFTAFVGVNNSGKSSLLRFLYEFRSLFQSITAPGNMEAALRGTSQSFTLPPSVTDAEQLFCDLNRRDLEIELRAHSSEVKALPVPVRVVVRVTRGTNTFVARVELPTATKFDPRQFYFKAPAVLDMNDPNRMPTDFSDYFAAFGELSGALYVGPFRNAINTGTDENYFDIQVGQAFIQAWRELKTGRTRRANEAAYRLTQDISHIFDFQSLEINPTPDDKTLQVFVNGRSYRLSELGSGLTQFILVLASAANRTPSYILIDEPEANLHPSLQLDFLTTLTSYARHGIVFATHSIGLARASADRIYALRKIAEGECELADFEGMRSLSEFLGELSFSGYRELGFDKILLVEGSTDVRAVQQLLRVYKKDHTIVLLPLGGSQMINAQREAELQEIKRISPNVSALIDSERRAAGEPLDAARTGFVAACQKVGITCQVLERRAIENYFTEAAVKRVKGDKYRDLQHYEKLSEMDPAWSKAENWRIAREMRREDLSDTDLGEFLTRL
jgi:ABC-type cobalamin/Fe3+-siderophores transport system ATPase subunit